MMTGAMIVWMIALFGFVLIEATTASLVTIWFAGGAAASLICAAVGASGWVQVFVFLGVSILLLALLRPMVKSWLHVKAEPTNADRIVGDNALVVEDIDPIRGRGAVKVGGVEWSARTADNSVIPEGSLVRVLRIEGAYVSVELIEARPESLSHEKVKAAFKQR